MKVELKASNKDFRNIRNIKNILLIDNSVIDYRIFIESVNENTLPIVYSSTDSRIELLNILKTYFHEIDRIGIVFISFGNRSQLFLESTHFFQERTIDNANVKFMIDLIRSFSIKHIDYLACNTLKYTEWCRYFDILTSDTGVIVGASDDKTGNMKYGGDWLMESTGQDIEKIYFNDKIDYYRYLLDYANVSMVITSDGDLYGCGDNGKGQLGLGNNNTITISILASIGKTPVSISCGTQHTIILMSDGTIYGTGNNKYGQLGIGNTTNQSSLMQISIPSGKTPSAIACGYFHTVVLMTDYTIYATGYNYDGELGDSTTIDKTTLSLMPNTTGQSPVAIACGAYYTMILMSSGNIYGTGYNVYGQLGDDTTVNKYSMTIMPNTTGQIPSSISCGSNHTVVLMANGSIYGTGVNGAGQLGLNNTTIKKTLTAMTIPSGKTPSSISCGENHTIVKMTDGTIYGTGRNINGELGNGTTTNQLTLTSISTGGKTPSSISCGNSHTIVTMTDGSIYGTGSNYDGQLGDGTIIDKSTFNQLINNTTKTPLIVTCGASHTMICMTDYSIYGTGYNNAGQLGLGFSTDKTYYTSIPNINGKTPLAIYCSYNITILLMNDGTLYGSGYDVYGQLGFGSKPISQYTFIELTNPTGKTPTAVSCGINHTILLMTDGTIYGSGYNYYGQLGIATNTDSTVFTQMTPVANKTPIAISCGGDFTIVLMIDGTIYGTGVNGSGQLGDGTTTYRNTLTKMTSIANKTPIAISCGYTFTIVLMSDGSVYGTGMNTSGQLGNGTTTNSSTLTLLNNNTGYLAKSISCGSFHTIITMSNDSIYGTGLNTNGQLGNGTNTNASSLTQMNISIIGKTPIAVTCGYSHTLVLMSDNTIYGTGSNSNGQLAIGNMIDKTTLTQMNSLFGLYFFPMGNVAQMMDSKYVLTTPTEPLNVTISINNQSVTISFSTPNSNGGLNIKYYNIVNENNETIASSAGSPISIYNLTNGTTYSFSVVAINSAGSGNKSSYVYATPITFPGIPTNINPISGDNDVTLYFDEPIDNGGSNIIGYIITDANNNTIASGPSAPIIINNLANGMEYTFYIKAYNSVGSGESVSFFAIPYSVPDAPIVNSAISENATGRIYFTIPNNNGSEITEYRVVDDENNIYSTNNTTNSPLFIYNLTNGTVYTLYLIAINVVGESPKSNSFTIFPYTTPSAPTITNIVSGNNYLEVYFSQPTSNGGLAITQYNVISIPGNKSTTGTSSPIRVSSLVNGIAYTLKIAAKNSAGTGIYSQDASAIPYTISDAPSITKVDIRNGAVDIYFTPPVNNGGLSIKSYNVYDNVNNISRTGFTTSPITLNRLTNNTTYSFFIKAVTNAGEGIASNVVNAIPRAVPSQPNITNSGAGSIGGSAYIFFNPPLNNGGYAVTSYIATSSPDGINASSSTSPITVLNLQKGIPYTFVVQAVNSQGIGPSSAPSSTVIPIGVPDRPVITSLQAGNRSVTLGFSPPLNTGGLPILRYTAKSIPDNIEVSGNIPNITVSNLTNGTSYTFILNATNAYGTSPYSFPSTSIVPYTVPDPPTGIAIDNGNRRADVYYTNPMNTGGAPITGYLLRDLSNQVISTGSSSPITIDRLANGQTLVNGRNYTFSLSVVNAAGPSSPSIFNVVPMTTPNTPNIINVATGFGYADVVFNPPTDNGGSDILYYTLYLGELEIIGYTSPIRIPDLLNGSSYSIRLSATNAAGTGSSTANYVFNMPSSVPGPPTITGLVAGNGYVDITLEPPVNTGGSPIIEYSFTPTPSADYNVTQYTSTFRYSGLTNGVSYTFTIRAINSDGSGEEVVSDSVIPYTVPDAPTITNIVASDESVVIYFDPPDWNGGSDILDYSVYYTGSDSSGSSVIASSGTTIYGLTNDVAYTFTMVARNTAGFSESSASFGPITPKSEKIDYCVKQSCIKAQYSQFTTGGNDPKITKAMRYSQLLSSRKPKTGFL
jgi:alpha-tubulin suppressor-like RCC1 family protein